VGVVTIKNNFIHGNQHDAGNGYGVAVRYGAYALITQNVFDENRHAIAGGSSDKKKDFSGYTLRDNLILPKGGFHCLANWGWQNCWKTHQIDMHGNMSTIFGGELCCGIAGETIIIERNTILYTGEGGDFLPALLGPGFAIKIRGNPADKAVVDGNIFKHRSSLAAIRQNGGAVRKCAWPFGWPCWTSETGIDRPIIVLPNNVFGVDPMAELGSCDFFGDGQQDQFMATGVTWWAKSPVTQEWRYLNTMPERLSQLQLRKIDGDAVCDVAPRTMLPEALPEKYSKGGTGSWVPLLVVNPQ
jgi:hypothetical protein